MSKNEDKDLFDKILTIGQNVIVGTFLLLSIYVFFIVPTYPKIDKSLPFNSGFIGCIIILGDESFIQK